MQGSSTDVARIRDYELPIGVRAIGALGPRLNSAVDESLPYLIPTLAGILGSDTSRPPGSEQMWHSLHQCTPRRGAGMTKRARTPDNWSGGVREGPDPRNSYRVSLDETVKEP